MPVPKRQHSKARSRKRVGGRRKVFTMSGFCPTCQAKSEQHSVCLGCGYYRGMKILRSKAERLEERLVVQKIKDRSIEDVVARKKVAAEAAAKKAVAEEDDNGK